jgi:AraC-like DNA-binding protein/DNA-binding XRE family transcriptional regulator
MNILFDPCETWDLNLTTRPKHSRLYALEPLGVSTPNIESLTSYTTRLADAHSVSLRTLVIQELLPLLQRDYLSNPFRNTLGSFWKEAVRALNGMGILARDWAQALEHLTLRTNLQVLTLLPWASVLTQQRLLRMNRAWCPDCFMEWQVAERPIYEPLLWNVSAVSLCVRHQRILLEQCPYPDCKATLPVLASYFRPGYCSKCSRWLGVTADPSDIPWTTEQWNWQIWVADSIGELVAHNTDLIVTPHRRNISDLIAAYRQQAADGSMRIMAAQLQLSRRTLIAWQQGRQIPQMESLMRLCYCCGVSLYDVFTSQSGTLDLGKLRIQSLPDIPNPTEKRRRRIPLDVDQIRKSLETVLASEEQPPPSMRTVAKRLNYSPRELREHFPELSHAISSRYKNYRKAQAEKKLEEQKDKVRRAIFTIHLKGFYPSAKRVDSLLGGRGMLRSPLLTQCWCETLQELELAD